MSTDPAPAAAPAAGVTVLAALAETVGRLGGPPEPRDGSDYLRLIEVAGEVERGSRDLLHDAVLAARSAGVTWAAIGQQLGVTKQAAQKRFVTDPAGEVTSAGPDDRLLGPIGFRFDEQAELALAGHYGWHLVEVGIHYHRLRHGPTQHEHLRVPMVTGRATRLVADGWSIVGSSFPYTYLTRDLAIPALVEPGEQ